jgi:hypothetical protein
MRKDTERVETADENECSPGAAYLLASDNDDHQMRGKMLENYAVSRTDLEATLKEERTIQPITFLKLEPHCR